MLTVTVPDQTLRDRLADLPVDLHTWDLASADGAPDGAVDLVVMPFMAPASTLGVLDGLPVRAVQSQALGYDHVADVLAPDVAFANAAGVHEAATAEHTLALVLAAQRDLPRFVGEQVTGDWDQRFAPGLVGRTVVLVGVGGVGEEIRRRLVPFDVEVVRVASHARTDGLGPVHGVDELADLVPGADVLVLAVPLNGGTRHLADGRLLAAMRPGALVVNVGRGPVVDTDALLAAVRDGRVRAALDVVDPEPLPADHPLRTTPGVLLTPHVAGRTTTMTDRVVALLRTQIEHLAAGDPLDHLVDLRRA
ncbi:NAD(P)-dependent oxidoreductase [Isoptericola sp. b441]|uniref:NAD(P)-dependent oxidoreductase n=1 Tax=Actinotalea lenta TaxID=3064654 RepID=A0ABT9DD14_9CELL|nr:NAD(P)-dependent oxidoreductase [Isoptericola sp. b441]MDO8108441.1 NAD(P)-dependent oxidoreductase [Isoptericola sp. b441]